MRIVIVGCGRVGGRLATDYYNQGHNVSVVDQRPHAFRHLPDDFSGTVVLGTGIDEDVLRQAGVESADVFIAVTDADNTNIMTAQIAQSVFHVEQVVLRIYDPVRAQIYRDLGMQAICPTSMVAGLIEEQIRDVDQTAV